ncbi:MAG: flagellar export chaperone FlgN [Opitutaceae bacterium]|nr:flagellar export chaperone FlgN [Opitutaceae bacterium]
MTIHWQNIADHLRAELADYGGLLHLMETQQRSLFDRDAGSVLRCATEIEALMRGAQDSRRRREQIVSGFATQHGQPAASTLRSLLAFIEADARPLIEALIKEVNLLIHRVRRTSRHNHTLLARTVEVHQETLQQLRPQAFTKTYSPVGRVAVSVAAPAHALEVAG